MSKFSLAVLEKCVYPFTGTRDPDVLLGASFGEDIALTRVGSDILASHVDPIVGAIDHIGWLAVHISCNDIATSGIPPRWILVLVLVPKLDDEELLFEIMKDINRAADEIGVSIIGGHTGYSSGISRPLVSITALGTAGDRTPVQTAGARLGDHVIVTKGIALEGTSILAADFADVAIQLGLSKSELAEARELVKNISVIPEAIALAENGATAMHDVTRGGLLETILEIAHLADIAIEVDYSRVSIHTIVSRFADVFQFNPLLMISSGTLVATIPADEFEAAAEALRAIACPFAEVGRVVKGKGVTLHQPNETIHYTKILAEKDELARMWAKFYP
jgi:hydrogenase expression/formation protein HypE